jgi:BioD-like phosphotransacetylase family protein
LIFANKSKKEKERQFLQPIKELAEKNRCKVSRFDLFNNSVIGIDELNNFIFLIRKTKGNEISLVINLMEIQKCRVNEVTRLASSKDGSVKIFDKIELVLTNKDKNKQDIIVEFYNSNYDRLTLVGELQMAEKWCKIANDKIIPLAK